MEWKSVEFSGLSGTRVKNHSAVYYKSAAYVFGGFDGSVHQNTLNIIDLNTLSYSTLNTSGDQPSGRNGHTATLYNSSIYIIGGWNSSNPSTTKEIYSLDLESLNWSKIQPTGEQMVPCNMHTSNLYQNKIFVFRGGDGINYLHDLHLFDLTNNSWNSVKGQGKMPSARANHASSVFNDHLYIFGGWNGNDRLNDLYRMAFVDYFWTKVDISGNLPKPRAGMSLLPYLEGLLLFGGSGESSESYSDLWHFNSSQQTWTHLLPSNPPSSRAGHSFTQISARDFLLLGGSSGNSYSSQNFILDTYPPPVPPTEEPFRPLSFTNFLNNPEFSDLQIIVENRVIYVHKIIITRLSEYFRQMFAFNMRETQENSIEIKGIRHSIFKILLKYLYTGEPEVGAGTEGQELSVEYLLEVLQAADGFLLMPIVRKCELMLKPKVTKDNVLEIQAAVEPLTSNYIKEYCAWFIKLN